MAENVLETRILLRYGTYAQWMNSDVILRLGEAAIAAFPSSRALENLSNSKPDYTPPAIGIKIGNGHDYFKDLPWVQAIAADVYNWAKQSVKPTYTAQEISGLQNFVENLISGDVEVTIAPRIYSITQGTGNNADKYYLQYKENNDEGEWIIDTSSFIDLTNLSILMDWIGQDIDNFPSLGNRTEEHIQYDLSLLKVTDSEQGSQVVTSVSQTNGKISSTKRQLNFTDLNGVNNVEHGGTGKNTLPIGEVLIGNDTNPIGTIPIDTEVAVSRNLVYNYAIKSYVDTQTAGLTGAMHFIGEAMVVIKPNSAIDPRIQGYNFATAQAGDVILYDAKEFVWTGSGWRLLGDEGSYAIKGSIKDADIDPEAAIQQTKIAGLQETFDTKVDKVDGMSLTSNNFTDELLQKLDGIQEGAQRNTIEHIFLNDTEIVPTTKQGLLNSIDLQISEFDENSQTKLNSIESEAQVNKVEKIIFDGNELTPDSNKTITINSDPHTEHENVIEQIFINDREQPVTNKQVRITIDQEALNLNVVAGAEIPKASGIGKDEVEQIQKKLQFERIAVSGDIKDLKQTTNTYVILNCGSSTEVI